MLVRLRSLLETVRQSRPVAEASSLRILRAPFQQRRHAQQIIDAHATSEFRHRGPPCFLPLLDHVLQVTQTLGWLRIHPFTLHYDPSAQRSSAAPGVTLRVIVAGFRPLVSGPHAARLSAGLTHFELVNFIQHCFGALCLHRICSATTHPRRGVF